MTFQDQADVLDEVGTPSSLNPSRSDNDKLLAIAKNRTDTRIYVRGDKTINYGRVLEVMGRLSGAGFSKVALISEPYKQ